MKMLLKMQVERWIEAGRPRTYIWPERELDAPKGEDRTQPPAPPVHPVKPKHHKAA